MSAKNFLKVLIKSKLLEPGVIAELRRQASDNLKVSAEGMAKALVDRGHLTKFQATQLVSEALALGDDAPEVKVKESKKKKVEEELELAPLDDDPPPKASPAPPKPALLAPDETVMLEEVMGLTPVEDAGEGLTPV